MIEYRSFRNSDPPRILALWHTSHLGPGAAESLTTDAFEILVFCQPYFDRKGLIVACDGDAIVGAVHAGFASNADGSALDRETGVICMVLVDPKYRRRGIGRELVARARQYLTESGSTTVLAGPSPQRNPFYNGLYGGACPAGFLKSDENADPFLTAIGFEAIENHAVFQRDTAAEKDPIDFRVVAIRRRMHLAVTNVSENGNWWWLTTFGRLDSLRFHLVPKEGEGQPESSITVVGLETYVPKWRAQSFALCDLGMSEKDDRNDMARALILEVCKRLREERYSLAVANIDETNTAVVEALEATGFERTDTGIVYRFTDDSV